MTKLHIPLNKYQYRVEFLHENTEQLTMMVTKCVIDYARKKVTVELRQPRDNGNNFTDAIKNVIYNQREIIISFVASNTAYYTEKFRYVSVDHALELRYDSADPAVHVLTFKA